VLAQAASYDSAQCDGVEGLTTDGTNVYWTAFCAVGTGIGLVLSIPTTGASGMTGTELTASHPGQALALNGNLYWQYAYKTSSNVDTCSPGNCSAPSSLGSSVYGGFTSNGTNLYWWAGTKGVDWCAISSCTTTSFNSLAANTSAGPYTMAANASTLFWLDTTAGGVLSCQTNVKTCLSPTTIISGRTGLGVVAADSTNVYWSDSAGVLECPIIGCGTPIVLGSGQTANSMGVDSQYVYWTTGSSVVRAKIGQASSATTIAPNESGAAPIAVGPSAVYWGLSNGDIVFVAK
jgi:hypothetical protein